MSILKTIIIILTSFSLIFFCKAIVHIFIEGQAHHNSVISEKGNGSVLETGKDDCCDLSDHSRMQDHFVVATIPQIYDLDITSFLLASALLVLFLGVFRYLDSFLYFLNIRQRFGSFNVFNPFLHYFRSGILNPKIF
jgi:hypothetical protein